MSAYNEEFKRQGYSTVLDQTNAGRREKMTDANIRESRDKSVIGVAVLPIVGKKNNEVNESKKENESTKRPKRTQTRKVSISLSSYHRRLATAAVLSATVALSGFGLSKKAVQQYKDVAVISTYCREFGNDVIKPEKHPTQDHMGYYYDYSDIAQRVMSYDNIDIAVYLLVAEIGEYQADRVLLCTPYKSIEAFYASRGYQDLDDFKKQARELLLLEDSVKKQQNELDKMKESHADYIFEPSKVSTTDMDDMFSEPIPFDSDSDIYSGGVK